MQDRSLEERQIPILERAFLVDRKTRR